MGDLSSSLVWSLFAFLFERLITMMNAITATRQKAGVSWIRTHGRSYRYFKLCQTYRRIPEFQPGSRRLFPFHNRPQVYQASCSSGPAPCSYTLSLGERSHTLNLCQSNSQDKHHEKTEAMHLHFQFAKNFTYFTTMCVCEMLDKWLK